MKDKKQENKTKTKKDSVHESTLSQLVGGDIHVNDVSMEVGDDFNVLRSIG